MYDGVLLKDGKYHVYVKTHNQTECCGFFLDKLEAKETWINCHKSYNHVDRSQEQVPVYELVPIFEYRLKRIE